MAQRSVAQPTRQPGAPEHPPRTQTWVSAYSIVLFTVTLGGNAYRNVFGWPVFLGIAALLVVTGIVLMVTLKPQRFRWYRLPAPVLLFLTLAVLSITWSAYRFESLLGTLAQLATTAAAVVVAYLLTWQETLRTLAIALRYLLGLSLVFELFVSLVLQRRVLPWWLEPPAGTTPNLLYWSRNLLFDGGPIQGLVGSSTLLGFLALLGLIVFAVQLRAGLVRPFAGWSWVGLALLMLALTRSATVTVALVFVAVTLMFIRIARRTRADRRMPMYFIGAGLLTATIVGTVLARQTIFRMLGKSADLTGRAETWEKVIALASERPWFGHGWISYWAPWVEPFESLDVQGGVQVMHAHNAWLDVWLQLGIVGLILFANLVFVATWRVWFRAVDQPRRGPGAPLPYATSAIWPALIVVAMLVQSLTESRILIEGGWLLLVLVTVKTRFDYEIPAVGDDRRKLAWRDVPIAQG